MARRVVKPPSTSKRPRALPKARRKPQPPAAPGPSASDASVIAGGPHPAPKPFPVVGVGASAGGLEAFSQLLRSLPADTGMAFVLVQHLAAKHESILPRLLERETTMTVREAGEGMTVEPNHVYVIPANQDMVIRDGRLALRPRTSEGRHMPVDLFLRTLADVQGSQAVAVVMSGTGSDGTLGCKAVKAAGGISFAQEPGSAKYDGMPRSAITAGCVDLVLPPDGIAREIRRLSGEDYLRPVAEKEISPPSEDDKDPFHGILNLLRKVTDTDFHCYKKPTLLRRIRRRMTLWKLDAMGEYLRWLERHPEEIESLHQDLLINVTTFFRDAAAFEVLAREICPQMLRNRPADAPVRIWVPGCATGEEAYSIAICLLEALTRTDSVSPIQIFGTDLSANAVEKARSGVYVENIAADVSPGRLARFFVKVDGSYQVSKAVRDLCVFAQHNLIEDAPFSRLDLVSCRNVLIYLEAPHQKRVLAAFHYALKPDGFLMLGPSETSGFSDLFDLKDNEHRVYTKRLVVSAPQMPLIGSHAGTGPLARGPLVTDQAGGRLHLQREADRVLLARYGPPGVLVDDNFDIIHFRGDTSAYLEHPHGEASLSLIRMLPPGTLVEVRRALQEARTKDAPVRRPLRLRHGRGVARRVTVEVLPIHGPTAGEGRCFLILFEEEPTQRPRAEPTPLSASPSARDGRIADLESELATTRLYQQTLLEEQEAANEELQSAHEEVLSSNEELQSINEELETAKE
jgi:two-component system, chemotaxis family, CheB/CheR fusion protein